MMAPRRSAAAVVLACSLLLLAVGGVHGLRGEQGKTAEAESLAPIETFGFEEGGEMQVSVTFADLTTAHPDIIIIMCSLDSLEGVLAEHNTIDSLCHTNMTSSCNWVTTLSDEHPTSSYEGLAGTSGLYDFVYLNCEGSSADIVATYEFVNPGGEQLSTGQIQFKLLSPVVAIVWGATVLLWLVNLLACRSKATTLFMCIGAIPVLHTIEYVAATLFWRKLSSTGVVNQPLFSTMVGVSSIATATMLCTVVLISLGWHIIRPSLSPRERQTLAGFAVLFLVAAVSWNEFGGFFFLFLLILVYVLYLRFIFAATSRQITIVATIQQYFASRSAGRAMHAQRQVDALKLFRSSQPIYIMGLVLVHVWGVMALERSPWIGVLLQATVHWCMATFLCIVFRLRGAAPYFRDPLSRPLLANEDTDSTGTAVETAVVIKNPNTLDASGKLVPNFALGVPLTADFLIQVSDDDL